MRRELKEDLDRIVETIIYLVTESRRLSKEEASRHGVTPTQLSVLKLLHEIGDLSLGTLSKEIRAHNSTVTGIVDRMEAAGLVERARSRKIGGSGSSGSPPQGARSPSARRSRRGTCCATRSRSCRGADQEKLTAIMQQGRGQRANRRAAAETTKENANGSRR